MKNFFAFFALFMAVLLYPVAGIAADELPAGDFLNQVMAFIQGFGGLSSVAKISGVVLILIASMKVTFIRSLLWDKLGAYKAFAAPVLGIIVGVLSMSPITLPGLAAYFFAGAGAIILHELLDAIKAIPGIGASYIAVIDFIKKALGGGNAVK